MFHDIKMDPRSFKEPDTVQTITTKLTINGNQVELNHDVRATLLDALRDRLGITSLKKGCNEGSCGACSILIDGQPDNACLALMASCEGRSVETIEGATDHDGVISRVKQAFKDQEAYQCGFCTPAQILNAASCIRAGHVETEAQIAEWMSGNLCRCAVYPQIVAAVQQAAKEG